MLLHYLNHPMGRLDRAGTMARILRWQLGSRMLKAPAIMPYVDDLRLVVETGMHGATGNAYVGLMEFNDMAFVAHLLREDDVFLDIGANVGTYSLLAASRGARVIAMEPVPGSYEALLDNVNLNRLQARIDARNLGVGGKRGKLEFSTSGGPTNHVVPAGAPVEGTIAAAVDTLDRIAEYTPPTMIKIDVEGFEAAVIEGATATLSQASLLALLIELNGLGARYGYNDSEIHLNLVSRGFHPVSYDPFQRRTTRLDHHNPKVNTLYLRRSSEVDIRLKEAHPILWRNVSI
ncbi:FkbM family methyltransferase [uncultured Thiohalocapsa sp.]|uniref:FkbM family methyltransferase n=1 Tax=uncultured Thiohalocapsa sp. TaxID=768990 RepID=UPI0025CF6883|nr:FkbM family methyltransferase [uncultured Thiohalocapsa sp.]